MVLGEIGSEKERLRSYPGKVLGDHWKAAGMSRL